MKITFTLLLFFLFALPMLHGQQLIQTIDEDLSGIWDSTITYHVYGQDSRKAYSIKTHLEESGDWENQFKYSYTYDNAGNVQQMQTDIWQNSSWLPDTRVSNTYNADNAQTLALTEQWDGAWSEVGKQESYYNATTELIDSAIVSIWNANDVVWAPVARVVYVYDAADLPATITRFTRSGSVWEPLSRTTYTAYNTSEQALAYIDAIWLGNAWTDARRTTNEWQDEQLYRATMDNWDADLEDWEQASRFTRFYNADGTDDVQVYQEYQLNSGQWLDSRRTKFIYGTAWLGLSETAFSTLNVYPNPAHEFVQITFGQAEAAAFTLTDLQGKIMLAAPVSDEVQKVSLQGLPAGTYLLNVTNGGQSATKRIVKH